MKHKYLYLALIDYNEKKKFDEAAEKALLESTPREKKILEMRFGLKDDQTHTLEEVGKEFCVTRERIRQIESKLLSRLSYQLKINQNENITL